MKVSIVEKVNAPFITKEAEIDVPMENEVLISVKASGLCHTDSHLATHDFGMFTFPALFGHEIAGVVESIGERVTEFEVGDHVVGCLIQYCGHCESCLSGRSHLCYHPEEVMRKQGEKARVKLNGEDTEITQGYGLGGFAEKALVHQNQLAKVPKEIPFSRACLLGCGTVTGAGAIINTAKVRPGDSVAIIGAGGVGLNAVSGAKIAGATTIIVIDIQDDKLEFSKRFGATHTINSKNEDPVAKVMEITERGVNAAFDVAGLPVTSKQAFSMIHRGGGAYIVGMHYMGTKMEFNGTTDFLFPAKKLEGVIMGSTNLKRDIPMYANLYLQGRMNLDDLIYQEIHIDDVQNAYDKLKEGGIIGRSVITSFE
ncbi:zinc-binding dehydrogenase [Chryseobacterium polytrichastri]|uniref:S-(Hydroxymethyl)glutathione dehydrogenase / alcohol dehydrogenase n=1 Tax=Chryseobacterium polytrichastri TaxID=1302687 RepID=A0A1M7KGC3_9FLAO|nr:Zn-dependent alcohol dehydrogenase [Chryseobacterium polytrichastri]SHM64276.1 S-(hydroxymethyl)glutathione dehydrogenase / alcohol dehydrogenase [Chryseobacterium polytrichastri]